MAEILKFAMERFGQLILALMYYTTDGTMPNDLPPDISMMFAIYQRKIDAARDKYTSKCATNAENGSKGGRPRKKVATDEPGEAPAPLQAEPPKKTKAPPKIKMPPTEAQITKLIQREQADGLISEKCDPEEFFEWAETLKWKINGEPAQNVGDFLAYAEAKYPPESLVDTIGIMSEPPFLVNSFRIIFKELHGLRDNEGNTGALVAAIDFLKAHDGGWSFHGQTFTDDQWREALSAFMQGLKTE